MFERLGRFVVHNPWKVILGWLLATAAIVLMAPGLGDVTSQDQADFLPRDYESVKAMEVAQRSFPTANDATATIVVKRADGQPLADADLATVGRWPRRSAGSTRSTWPAPSGRPPPRRTGRSPW